MILPASCQQTIPEQRQQKQAAACCSLLFVNWWLHEIHEMLMQDAEAVEDSGGHDAACFPPADSQTQALPSNCGKQQQLIKQLQQFAVSM